ncbi:uncharacterized protein TrAFT101_009745 [Trichoderma asperellum]|uniref:uncharacterized protein n=1 Tax=Trichoderma asperellum TaxID=101201 RepID=UPI00332814FE|nr:hypothetical protein TrAFT101_009745 [Trichoderma asperellum]
MYALPLGKPSSTIPDTIEHLCAAALVQARSGIIEVAVIATEKRASKRAATTITDSEVMWKKVLVGAFTALIAADEHGSWPRLRHRLNEMNGDRNALHTSSPPSQPALSSFGRPTHHANRRRQVQNHGALGVRATLQLD